MRTIALTLCILLGTTLPFVAGTAEGATRAASPQSITVGVDTRVELAATMARLAGYPEYRNPGIAAYDRAVDAHFARFANHPSIMLMRKLRADHGISYNAVVEAALAADPVTWKPVIRLSPWPGTLDSRWNARTLKSFLDSAKAFERDTGARGFFARQQPVRAQAEASVRANLEGRLDVDWYRTRMPASPQAISRYIVIPGLLDGPNSYAVQIGDRAYGVLATPVFRDGDAIEYPADAQIALLVHEFHHRFMNPWVDANYATLSAPAGRLYKIVESRMGELAYGDPRIMLYESLVRANTVSYFRQHGEEAVLRRQLAEDAGKDFAWVAALADLLDKEEADGKPRFNSGTPAKLAEFLDAWAANDGAKVVAERQRHAAERTNALARGPQLEGLSPADGVTAPAGNAVLELRFDRPMDGRIAVFGDIPKVTGKPHWDEEKRVLRIPVLLAAGANYRILLNNEEEAGFASADGEKLTPRSWVFGVSTE